MAAEAGSMTGEITDFEDVVHDWWWGGSTVGGAEERARESQV